MHESAAAAAPTRRNRGPSPSRRRTSSTSRRDKSQGRGRDKHRGRRSKDKSRSTSPSSRSNKSDDDKKAAICIPVGLACKMVENDYWEISEDKCWVTRHHVEPRNERFGPTSHDCPVGLECLKSARWTMIAREKNKFQTCEDNWRTACPSGKAGKTCKGKTMFKVRKQFCQPTHQQCPPVSKVSFNTTPQVYTHEVDCIAYSHEKSRSKPSKTYATSKCPRSDVRDTEEAIKCAQSLQAMLKSMLSSSGEMPKCKFVCDHDPVGPHDLCCTKCRLKHGGESPRFSMVPSTPAKNYGMEWD